MCTRSAEGVMGVEEAAVVQMRMGCEEQRRRMGVALD